jgi:hypothetical protein
MGTNLARTRRRAQRPPRERGAASSSLVAGQTLRWTVARKSARIAGPMATVELTRHLYQFFPALEGKDVVVQATTVAEVVRELDRIAPGIAFYICDEHGRLRRHVNIFVAEQSVCDRERLTDPVRADSRVFILQALSGG